MGLKYKYDINWKDIQRGLPYKPTKSETEELADVFTTASTTLAEEVTQDFADDNTRLHFSLSIRPPSPKLEYYSSFTIKSNESFGEEKKAELNRELIHALANAQQNIALQLDLNMSLSYDENGQPLVEFKNISSKQRARFDVELHRQLPTIFNDVCKARGYDFEMSHSNVPQSKMTPLKMIPDPYH